MVRDGQRDGADLTGLTPGRRRSAVCPGGGRRNVGSRTRCSVASVERTFLIRRRFCLNCGAPAPHAGNSDTAGSAASSFGFCQRACRGMFLWPHVVNSHDQRRELSLLYVGPGGGGGGRLFLLTKQRPDGVSRMETQLLAAL